MKTLALDSTTRSGRLERGERTEDELLGRGQHVQGEGDLVLVIFLLQPLHETSRLEEEVGGGDHDETGAECVGSRGVGEEVHGRVRFVAPRGDLLTGMCWLFRRLTGLVE